MKFTLGLGHQKVENTSDAGERESCCASQSWTRHPGQIHLYIIIHINLPYLCVLCFSCCKSDHNVPFNQATHSCILPQSFYNSDAFSLYIRTCLAIHFIKDLPREKNSYKQGGYVAQIFISRLLCFILY